MKRAEARQRLHFILLGARDMLHEIFDPKVLGPGLAALIPWNGLQPWSVYLRFNDEISRSWIGYLQKRYTKDMDALQRFLSIKLPAEFASFSIAFWQDAAQDYFSELAELQKLFSSLAKASPIRGSGPV